MEKCTTEVPVSTLGELPSTGVTVAVIEVVCEGVIVGVKFVVEVSGVTVSGVRVGVGLLSLSPLLEQEVMRGEVKRKMVMRRRMSFVFMRAPF